MARRRSGRGCGALLLNLISLLIVMLILLAIAGVVAVVAAPDLVAPVAGMLGISIGQEEPELAPTPTLVAVAQVPTATPTTAEVLRPTWTAQAPVSTALPTATNTRRPTAEPSVTVTFPPPTNTPTITPSPTATSTPGPPPTATVTRAPYPFTKSVTSPMYLQNFANNAGCEWMGIAGEVLDLNGNPVGAGQYRVHVWGSGIEARVPAGGAVAYGPSGYEQFLFNAPVIRDYNVQLETESGSAVSQVYSVQSRSSCNQNLVIFNFIQNH